MYDGLGVELGFKKYELEGKYTNSQGENMNNIYCKIPMETAVIFRDNSVILPYFKTAAKMSIHLDY